MEIKKQKSVKNVKNLVNTVKIKIIFAQNVLKDLIQNKKLGFALIKKNVQQNVKPVKLKINV